MVEICNAPINLPSAGFNSAPITFKLWYAAVSGYSAPTTDSSNVVSTYRMIMPTVVLNFNWAKSVIANVGVQESIIINNAIQQWQQSDAQMLAIYNSPSAAVEWIDALDGVQTGTVNGHSFKVPYWANDAWVSSSLGTLYASTVSNPQGLPAGALKLNLS